MAIRDVDLTITRETTTATQAGFGLPLILGTTKDHEYTLYRNINDVSDDFDTDDPEYRFANRIFAQSPRPPQIAIASIEGDSGSGGSGGSGGGGGDDEEGSESQSFDPMASSSDLVTALNRMNEDYYFLLCTDQSEDVVDALADWVETQNKLYFFSTDDEDLIASVDSERAIGMLHDDETAAAGWVGRCAPTDPGSITWKFKQINGIGKASGISSRDIEDTIGEDGNGNAVISQGGVEHTTPGRTTSGEFIDILRSQDFVETRLKERVFNTLVNADKVPFTNTGIAMIRAAVESVLKSAFNNGIIADDEDGQPLYTISTPDRTDVSTEDRATRTLPDIDFEFELAGAIHEVAITGAIRV